MVYINILNLYVAHCCVFLSCFILWCIFLCVYYAGYKYLNNVEHEPTLLQNTQIIKHKK